MTHVLHHARVENVWLLRVGISRELVFVRHLDFLNEGTPIELCNLKCVQHQCRGFFFYPEESKFEILSCYRYASGRKSLISAKNHYF